MLVLTTLRITPCSHFRDPSDNFGKSIDRTSTFPGPTYTTPRLLAINVPSTKNLECFGASFRHRVILLSGTAANAHTAYHFPPAFQRDAAGEYHHAPMVGHLDSEELTARLRILREILRRNIEGTGSECLVNRDIDAADPGTVHANVGNKVAPFVDDRNVHGMSDFTSLPFGGLNDFTCFLQRDHEYPFRRKGLQSPLQKWITRLTLIGQHIVSINTACEGLYFD